LIDSPCSAEANVSITEKITITIILSRILLLLVQFLLRSRKTIRSELIQKRMMQMVREEIKLK